MENSYWNAFWFFLLMANLWLMVSHLSDEFFVPVITSFIWFLGSLIVLIMHTSHSKIGLRIKMMKMEMEDRKFKIIVDLLHQMGSKKKKVKKK